MVGFKAAIFIVMVFVGKKDYVLTFVNTNLLDYLITIFTSLHLIWSKLDHMWYLPMKMWNINGIILYLEKYLLFASKKPYKLENHNELFSKILSAII